MAHLKIIFTLFAFAAAVTASAQDDLYFTPSAKQVKHAKAAREKLRELKDAAYYSGINKSIDEYNRRNKKSSYTLINDSLVADDVIEFQAGTSELDDDLAYSYDYEGNTYNDSDYELSRRLGRFDNMYDWYDPFLFGYHGWGRYYGWYDPWYYGYYDPWFYGYYSPWSYYACYGSIYGWYSPWFYRHWYWDDYHGYGGWAGPTHINLSNSFAGTTRHSRGPVHASSTANGAKNVNYSVAQRNDARQGSFSGRRTATVNGQQGQRFGLANGNNGTTVRNSAPVRQSAPAPSTSSFSGGGSFGGGHSGGSFSSSGSTGGGGGGGHFGGRR